MFDKYIPLFERSDWPIILRPLWSQYFFENIPDEKKTDSWYSQKKAWLQLVIDLLAKKQIYIDPTGTNDDKTREKIDTVVIHHSYSKGEVMEKSNSEIVSWINALQLIRLYADYYSNSGLDESGQLTYSEFNKPIFSGHFLNEEQTFIAYHWLVFPDGGSMQTLKDEYVGWHAGKINAKSIAICLVGDFSQVPPSSQMLVSVNQIIEIYKSKYKISKILGHGEIMNTECPGKTFYGDNGWKRNLCN